MQFRMLNQFFLIISIIRWAILAIIIGLIAGTGSALLSSLLAITGSWSSQGSWVLFTLPFIMALTAAFSKKFPGLSGHDTDKVIKSLHRNSGRLNVWAAPVKLLTTTATIAAGGSAGKEGPSAFIGATLASGFADLFRMRDYDRKLLVICGISAGFSAVFGTPVAGAVYALEILYIGEVMYEAMLPSFLAGLSAYYFTGIFKIQHIAFRAPEAVTMSETAFLQFVLFGVIMGLVSLLFIAVMKKAKEWNRALPLPAAVKAFAAGSLIVLLAHIISRDYLGLGTGFIEHALAGRDIIWYAFLAKMLFTALTLGFGGSGGLINPVFFIGAAAGSVLGKMLGLDPSVAASAGLAAMLAGSTSAPLSASILAIELFGMQTGQYAALACITAFIMTGNNSVYPSQKISINKYILLSRSRYMRYFRAFIDYFIRKGTRKGEIKGDKDK